MLDKILRRGQSAKEFINNEAFRDAVKAVEAGLITELKATKLKDSEGREKLYMAIRALNDVTARLESYIREAAYERKKPQ